MAMAEPTATGSVSRLSSVSSAIDRRSTEVANTEHRKAFICLFARGISSELMIHVFHTFCSSNGLVDNAATIIQAVATDLALKLECELQAADHQTTGATGSCVNYRVRRRGSCIGMGQSLKKLLKKKLF